MDDQSGDMVLGPATHHSKSGVVRGKVLRSGVATTTNPQQSTRENVLWIQHCEGMGLQQLHHLQQVWNSRMSGLLGQYA